MTVSCHQALGRCRCGDCHTISEAISLNEGGVMDDAPRAMQTVDAMADFLAALEQLGPHMEAIGQVCSAAVSLQRWGTSFDLQVQGLTRDEYDGFDGEDTHFPPTPERSQEFWSKKVHLYSGGFDHESDRRLEGDVVLTLYTRFAPVKAPALA